MAASIFWNIVFFFVEKRLKKQFEWAENQKDVNQKRDC